MDPDARIEKPASGFWSDAHPELGTGPISLDDSISPDFYELEREHIFRRTWLYMGRVERLPQRGSYFTRELPVANTSVVLARGEDDRIRAFHNICAHRGNKLVWKDSPGKEVQGRTKQFHCRFHGWRFGLDGSLVHHTRPELFPNLDPSKCRLPEIACEVWEGFVFIHLDPENREPLRSFLGEMAHGLEGFPYERFSQAYTFRMEISCNWKIFLDSFAEGYHGPYLHSASLRDTATAVEAEAQHNPLADALAMQFVGPHRMISWAGERPRETDQSTPTQRVMGAGAAGLWTPQEPVDFPPGVNPSRSPIWNIDSFMFFPNFTLNFRNDNYSVKSFWPTGPDTHQFEITNYFQPPRSWKEKLGQELMVLQLHDVVLEDISPLEGMQEMLKSRALQEFHTNDEELLVRHLHKVVHDYVGSDAWSNGG